MPVTGKPVIALDIKLRHPHDPESNDVITPD